MLAISVLSGTWYIVISLYITSIITVLVVSFYCALYKPLICGLNQSFCHFIFYKMGGTPKSDHFRIEFFNPWSFRDPPKKNKYCHIPGVSRVPRGPLTSHGLQEISLAPPGTSSAWRGHITSVKKNPAVKNGGFQRWKITINPYG